MLQGKVRHALQRGENVFEIVFGAGLVQTEEETQQFQSGIGTQPEESQKQTISQCMAEFASGSGFMHTRRSLLARYRRLLHALLMGWLELGIEGIEGGNRETEHAVESRWTARSVFVGDHACQFTQFPGRLGFAPQIYCHSIYI